MNMSNYDNERPHAVLWAPSAQSSRRNDFCYQTPCNAPDRVEGHALAIFASATKVGVFTTVVTSAVAVRALPVEATLVGAFPKSRWPPLVGQPWDHRQDAEARYEPFSRRTHHRSSTRPRSRCRVPCHLPLRGRRRVRRPPLDRSSASLRSRQRGTRARRSWVLSRTQTSRCDAGRGLICPTLLADAWAL